MGKPYDHEFHFSGSRNITGTMVCEKCRKPIINTAHDWMSYKRNKSYDWRFYTFHRKCCDDQSGWERIEKNRDEDRAKCDALIDDLMAVAQRYGIKCPYEFADIAASALGEHYLSDHYFGLYGSS